MNIWQKYVVYWSWRIGYMCKWRTWNPRGKGWPLAHKQGRWRHLSTKMPQVRRLVSGEGPLGEALPPAAVVAPEGGVTGLREVTGCRVHPPPRP